MKSALIGYTGFAGSNLAKQHNFTNLYNSKNIADIKNKSYDLIVSAGNSSIMWKANQEPEKDWESIQLYVHCIKTVKTKHFVLLSTVEVYDTPINVDEDTVIMGETKPYGLHRYKLEQIIKEIFTNVTIIRLPNLFGEGLKKNYVYDLMHNNRLELVHKDSVQQWYSLNNIWKDISIALKNNLPLVNFATEPISNKELAKEIFDMDFTNVTEAPPRKYNMQTKYAELFGGKTPYIYDKKQILKMLKEFVEKEKSKR